MHQRLALLTTVFMLTGCASVLNESTHPMKVETKSAAGELVAGADCKLTNDYGTVTMKSGDTTPIRRSGKDLDIVCQHPGNPNASARAVSRANSGMYGNIILGGVVGAIVDHNKGTAYTYPTWVQLVFGKTLIFDRSTEKDGQPALGTEGIGAATAAPIATVTTTLAPVAPPVPQALPRVAPIAPVANPVSTVPELPPAQTAAKAPAPSAVGQDSYNVERMPEMRACSSSARASLTSRGPGFETYIVPCTSGDVLIVRCEMGNCRVLK